MLKLPAPHAEPTPIGFLKTQGGLWMKTQYALVAGIGALLAALISIAPSAAQASQGCECENGVTVHTADDDANACVEACEGMGGWAPEDDGDDDDDDVVVVPRRPPASKPGRPRR
jgi:hypothetical protein